MTATSTAMRTPQGSFDYVKFPLVWDLTNLVPGGATTLSVGVNSAAGYLISQTKGILLFDYYGKPGIGQAYFVPLTVGDMPRHVLPADGQINARSSSFGPLPGLGRGFSIRAIASKLLMQCPASDHSPATLSRAAAKSGNAAKRGRKAFL